MKHGLMMNSLCLRRLPRKLTFWKRSALPRLLGLLLVGSLLVLFVFVRSPGQRTGIDIRSLHDIRNPCRRDLQDRIEDILGMKPPAFLPNYKNPCWESAGSLRCLPYFHVIGSPKSGTTDLFIRMVQHPDILENKGLGNKETWYWSWKRYGRRLSNYHFNHTTKPSSLTDFIKIFEAKQIEETQTNGYHSLITGHGDPMDFADFRLNCLIAQNDPGAWEPNLTTPFLIKHINPRIKLILLLRDPAERLYSYYFFTHRGNTSLDFHNDVIKSLDLWNECRRSYTERFCLYNYNVSRFMKVALTSSFYSTHLKEWLKVFPREQILVLRTEDYHKDVKGTLKRVFDYLNIRALPESHLQMIASITERFQTESKTQAGPMLTRTRQLLVGLYRESTKDLGQMLNDERFTFKDVSFS